MILRVLIQTREGHMADCPLSPCRKSKVARSADIDSTAATDHIEGTEPA